MTASRSHATQYVVAGLIAVVALLLSVFAWPGAEEAGGEEATKVSSDPGLPPAPEQRQWTRRLEPSEEPVDDGETIGGDPLHHLPELDEESKTALAGIIDGLAGPRHLQRQDEIVTMALDGIADKLAEFTKIRQTRRLTEEELREEAKYLERQYL